MEDNPQQDPPVPPSEPPRKAAGFPFKPGGAQPTPPPDEQPPIPGPPPGDFKQLSVRDIQQRSSSSLPAIPRIRTTPTDPPPLVPQGENQPHSEPAPAAPLDPPPPPPAWSPAPGSIPPRAVPPPPPPVRPLPGPSTPPPPLPPAAPPSSTAMPVWNPAPGLVPAHEQPEPPPLPPKWEPDQTEMPPPPDNVPMQAVALSAATAFGGIILWALLILTFKHEFGFVAWAIGAGIGATASYFRGRGTRMGLIAAAFALIAMFGGRYAGFVLAHDQFMEELSDVSPDMGMSSMDMEPYYVIMHDVADHYATLTTDNEFRDFYYRLGFFPEKTAASQITASELADAKEDPRARILHDMTQEDLSYDEWESRFQQYAREFAEKEYSTTRLFFMSLSILDVIFVVFGCGSAYWIAQKRDGAF